jgi:hypothetical protein
MNKDNAATRSIRHAVMAVAVVFAGQRRRIPASVRTASQALADRVMGYLDRKRVEQDPGVMPIGR